MSVKERAKHILAELKGHVPFTLFGALLGIFFLLLFRSVGNIGSHTLFVVFHPSHVVLSAMVTASMFNLHAAKKRFLLVLVVGYFGSVGIATLSDIVIPHIGSRVLRLDVPTHARVHHSEISSEDEERAAGANGHRSHKIHLGFIEDWYIVNPAALLGVLIAFYLPRTKFPHAAHVLVSTWASASYLLMDMESDLTVAGAAGIFVTLFMAVWVPCCISDIVFPLLFVKPDLKLAGGCPRHWLHSHEHAREAENDE